MQQNKSKIKTNLSSGIQVDGSPLALRLYAKRYWTLLEGEVILPNSSKHSHQSSLLVFTCMIVWSNEE